MPRTVIQNTPKLLKYFVFSGVEPSREFMDDLKEYLNMFQLTRDEMLEEIEKLNLGSNFKRVVMKVMEEIHHVC